MIVVMLAASAFSIASALPQSHSGPSPVLSARQEVVTNAYGITKTVQESDSGPNKALTIGATAAVIVGFIVLILGGVWIGSRRSKKNAEWRKSMIDAQNEAKKQHRLTMQSGRPGSALITPGSSISSTSNIDRKSSALSLTPSTASSFVSSGAPNTSPTHEQRRPTVLHHPTPRTPSILVQNSLLQHSEYPPPSNDRSVQPQSPETNRVSFYQQQPSRPSPLSNSVTLPPSEAVPLTQSPPSFEPPTRNNDQSSDGGPPPATRRPPAFQPPAKRKSSGDINLTITVPPHHGAPNTPPGLDNNGFTSPNSIRSGEMGKAF